MSRNKIIHVGCVGPFNLEIRREFRSQRYGGTTSTAGSRVVVITSGIPVAAVRRYHKYCR